MRPTDKIFGNLYFIMSISRINLTPLQEERKTIKNIFKFSLISCAHLDGVTNFLFIFKSFLNISLSFLSLQSLILICYKYKKPIISVIKLPCLQNNYDSRYCICFKNDSGNGNKKLKLCINWDDDHFEIQPYSDTRTVPNLVNFQKSVLTPK